MGLSLMLVLAGCTGSGDPSGTSNAGHGEQSSVVQPTGTAPSVGTQDHSSDDADAETPPTGPRREPLVDLGAGTYAVNVRTGAAVRLPKAFTSIPAAGNYDVSPDGTMILFDNASHTTASNEPARRGRHQLYVADIDGTDLHQLTDDPLGASQGSWSPDGTKVVYLGGWAKLCCWRTPANLMVVDLATGTTRRVAAGQAKRFYNPMFSSDGSAIISTRYHAPDETAITTTGRNPPDRGYDLWTIPVGGGRPKLLLENMGYDAAYSPDGAAITYPRIVTWHEGNSYIDYTETWISDADGSHARRLVRRGSGRGIWSPNGRWIFYYKWYGPPPPQRSWGAILDTRTGQSILLSAKVSGYGYDWLDNKTLIVRSQRR